MCWGIAHLRVLAPPSVFAGVANELTAIMGEQPIEVVQEEGDEEEEEGEEPRELVWLLDLTGQVAPKWQPQLVLCDPDVENEAELRFLQTHGAGLSQVSGCVDESGAKRRWSDTTFRRVACTVSIDHALYLKKCHERRSNKKERKTYIEN
jgi:hypothetical protein